MLLGFKRVQLFTLPLENSAQYHRLTRPFESQAHTDMSTPGKKMRTPARKQNESSQSEPEVPVQTHAHSSRKGKRQSDLSTDLQPSSKKSYNLRSSSSLCNEEVLHQHPTINYRKGKKQPETDSDMQPDLKKSSHLGLKTSSLPDEEGCQQEKDGIDEKIENVNKTLQDSHEIFWDAKEAQDYQQEKEGIDEETENVDETAQDNIEFSQEAKESQVCQHEKEGIDEEIKRSIETSQDCNELSQDAKEPQGCQQEKDRIEEEIEIVNKTLQDSNELSQDAKEAQNCQQEKEGNDEETENAKEAAQDSIELSQEPKEAQACFEEDGTAEELVNVEEDTPKVSIQLSTKKRKHRKRKSSSMRPKIPVAAGSKILFVGNLPYSVDHGNMLKFFEDVGKVVDIRMAKCIDGSMKGFCHVTFETEAAAKKAMDKNGEILGGRNVKLDFAKEIRNKDAQNCTVLVRGFEKSQEEEVVWKSLMKHFGNCGGIKVVHLPKDIPSGCLMGVAFIEFEDSGSLSKALELCGSELGNCKLFVKAASRNEVRRNVSKRHRKKHSKKKAAVKDTKEICQ